MWYYFAIGPIYINYGYFFLFHYGLLSLTILVSVTEYAYSSKATTKCDVYSFGVVLMELITGKRPVEPEFGENRNIICWISTKVDTKESTVEVLDKRLSGSFREDIIRVLWIAIRCTYGAPALRPAMNEVVQLLKEADPCKFDSRKLSDKTKETFNPPKTK